MNPGQTHYVGDSCPGGHVEEADTCPGREAHCWHTTKQYRFVNAVRTGGSDIDRCCYCGRVQKYELVNERDPDHGPFAPERTVRKAVP